MIGLRAFFGFFPKTSEFENKRIKLENEYNAVVAFETSKEIKRYNELNKLIQSVEFANKKKELLSLRFNQTAEYQKEKEFVSFRKSKDIRLFYKILGSEQILSFNKTDKSAELKKYFELEKFINSKEFAEIKKETSLSSKRKFEKSDEGKTLELYIKQKESDKIRSYFRFINHKYFASYISGKDSGLPEKIKVLEIKITSSEFLEKKLSMKKKEFKNSKEFAEFREYISLKNSRPYKKYLILVNSPMRKYYDELHGSKEIEAFEDLQRYVSSVDFKQQRRAIENYTFKATPAFKQFEEYNRLKKSSEIRSYFKFKDSDEYKNFLNLKDSDRIKSYEKLRDYINSNEFIEHKAYCNKSPKKRWKESENFQLLKEFELLKIDEKIKWYFRSLKAKKFAWLRVWKESFMDDFIESKLDKKKWITRYYYGEEMLKDSYSLSQDKHFVTDGKNIDFDHSILRIITRKEVVKGKSWHPKHGFITREFGYTSGLVSTGKNFRQKYGTFEAKIKFDKSKQIQNAFWMVSKTMVPHIDIAKANGKLVLGNAWGNAKDLKSIKIFSKKLGRTKFTEDFYIFTLEWLPEKLIWKINGVEIASSKQGVPQEPMYVVLSSGLQYDVNSDLPAQMEIDWIRCFQKAEYLENN
jgi:hypothetical protein